VQWSNGGDYGGNDTIDEVHNPKGMSFATWMLDPLVMGSTTRDSVVIQSGTGKSTATSVVDTTNVEQWVYTAQGMHTQNFQYATPVESDTKCGKVVFSDMHVSGGPGNGNYPDSCQGGNALTPQEKALAFMFFDLSSCVGAIF